MKRNAEGISSKSKARRPSKPTVDMFTQTEKCLVHEDITRVPVVLLDKSTITKFTQGKKAQETQVQKEIEENSSRNIGRVITTTNYSTFLRPITNNEYANSTLDSNKKSKMVAKKKAKRRVNFFRPNSIRQRKDSSSEQEMDLRMRDVMHSSAELVPIPERTEVEQSDETPHDIEEDNENHQVQSIEIGSINVCEMSLNAEIQELLPNMEDSSDDNGQNIFKRYSTKGTSTESSEVAENDAKFDCVRFKFNANSVTIHNNFYGRKNDLR